MLMSPIQISKEERLRLDSVRGFLCFAAFCYHFFKGPLGAIAQSFKEQVKYFFVDGYAGVNVFFMISGFLVLNSFLHLKNKYPEQGLLFFYIKRFFRTIPAWFFALIVYTVLFVEAPSISDFLWNFFFIFAWQPFQFKQITVIQSWSLFIEELFYLLFPLCLYAFRKKHILYWLISYFVLSALIKKMVYVPNDYVYFNIFFSIRFFAIGIVGFLFLDQIKKMKSEFLFYFSFISLFATSLAANKFWLAEAYCIFWLHFIFAGPESFAKPFNKMFSGLGKICYSYYLIHVVFISKAEDLFNSEFIQKNLSHDVLKVATTFLLSFMGSVVFAYLFYYSIELVFMKFGQKIVDRLKLKDNVRKRASPQGNIHKRTSC